MGNFWSSLIITRAATVAISREGRCDIYLLCIAFSRLASCGFIDILVLSLNLFDPPVSYRM